VTTFVALLKQRVGWQVCYCPDYSEEEGAGERYHFRTAGSRWRGKYKKGKKPVTTTKLERLTEHHGLHHERRNDQPLISRKLREESARMARISGKLIGTVERLTSRRSWL